MDLEILAFVQVPRGNQGTGIQLDRGLMDMGIILATFWKRFDLESSQFFFFFLLC